MAIVVHSPRNSFVKFDSPEESDVCCNEGNTFCTPVVLENDLKFQFSINCDTELERNTLWSLSDDKVALQLLRGTTNAAFSVDILRNWATTDSLYFEKYITGPTQITYLWRERLMALTNLLQCNECFQLGVLIQYPGVDPLQVVSNCMVHPCSECYTAVIEYSCEDNYDEFVYCGVTDPVNKVRLPMYLGEAQFPEEAAKYRKSSGVIKTTKSTISKEYSGLLDYAPEHIHEKLRVAFGHDIVGFIDSNYTGGVSLNGGYNIDWIKGLCFAQSNFKVFATPYLVRNNNCEDCPDIVVPIVCAAIQNIAGGTGDDPGTPSTWLATVTGLTWVTAPAAGFNQTVDIYYREQGSGSAFTLAGTMVFDPAGAIVSSPNPFVINAIPDAWSRIDLRAVNQCSGDEFTREYINPIYVVCEPPTGLAVSDITSTSAQLSWNRVLSSPGPYNWELIDDTPTTVQTGDWWNPGATLILLLSTLTPDTHYTFRVRSNCGTGGYSVWVTIDFTTLP